MNNEAVTLANKIICKRLFGFITAMLLLIIPGAVDAQNLKFDGYLNSGLGVVYSSSADKDTVLKAFGVDSEQNGFRFRLNGSFSTDAGMAGLKFRFQSQSNLNLGFFSLPYVYGWINLFEDILYIAGGIVDDSSWQTRDWWINDDVGEGLGLLVRVQPIPGLYLGAGAYIISQQAAGSNNILSFGSGTNSTLPNFSNITPKIQDAKYTFSASYTLGRTVGFNLEDVFYIGATFRMKNKAGWNCTLDIDRFGYIYDGRQESSLLIGEFRFLMLPRLTANIAFSLDKLEDFAAKGNIIISQTFAYEFRRVMLGLNSAEYISKRKNPLGKKISYYPGLLFNLWASYTYTIFEPRLDLVYFWGGRSTVGGDETYKWHRHGFINREIFDIGSDNIRIPSVFSVRPSIKINLMSRAFIEIGNMFNYDFGNYDAAYGDSGDLKKRTRISNVSYIDLRWSF